jgi:hypothetical protein
MARGRVLVFAERDMAEATYLAGAAILEESGRELYSQHPSAGGAQTLDADE